MSECGRIMVGSGTDTYDPICELPEAHSGPCKSTAAIDQNRLVPRRSIALMGRMELEALVIERGAEIERLRGGRS